MVEHSILLNIKQQGPVGSGIEVTQGDYGKVRLVMRVKDGDSYITDAERASVSFKLSNGYIVTGDTEIVSGTYIYTFKGNELQAPGKVVAVITLMYGDGRVSSCGFTFDCRPHPLYSSQFEAGNYIPALEKIVKEAEGQVDYLKVLIEELQKEADVKNILTRSDLVNDASTTEAGIKALDAAMGKTLDEKDKELEKKINDLLKGSGEGSIPDSVLTKNDLVNDLNTEITSGEKAIDAALIPQIKQAIENGGGGGSTLSGGYVYVEPEEAEEGNQPVPEPMLDADALRGHPSSYYAPQSQISDAFSEDVDYDTGQYCINNNVLCRFTSPKSAGPWDESKVESCTVMGELSSLNGKTSNVFSFDEVRIGTWIDGKPLYRKMIDFGALPASGNKSVSTGVENVDLGYINLGNSFWKDTTPTNPNIYTFVFRDNIRYVSFSPEINSVRIAVEIDSSIYAAMICFEYTKTTDQASPSS